MRKYRLPVVRRAFLTWIWHFVGFRYHSIRIFPGFSVRFCCTNLARAKKRGDICIYDVLYSGYVICPERKNSINMKKWKKPVLDIVHSRSQTSCIQFTRSQFTSRVRKQGEPRAESHSSSPSSTWAKLIIPLHPEIADGAVRKNAFCVTSTHSRYGGVKLGPESKRPQVPN